jgi:hypothetical protein
MVRRRRNAPRSPSRETPTNFGRVRDTFWGTAGRVLLARMFGVGHTGGAEDEEESEEAAEVYAPAGYVSRPDPDPSDPNDPVECVYTQDGDETHVLFLVNKGLPPAADADCAKRETLIHGVHADNVLAHFKIHANGNISIVPKPGQKLYLGGAPGSGTEPVMPGVALKAYLDALKAAIIALRTDMALVMNHVHGGMGASPSPTLAAIPTGAAPGTSPTNSPNVEVKT